VFSELGATGNSDSELGLKHDMCFEQSCRPFLENGSDPAVFVVVVFFVVFYWLSGFLNFKPKKTIFSR